MGVKLQVLVARQLWGQHRARHSHTHRARWPQGDGGVWGRQKGQQGGGPGGVGGRQQHQLTRLQGEGDGGERRVREGGAAEMGGEEGGGGRGLEDGREDAGQEDESG